MKSYGFPQTGLDVKIASKNLFNYKIFFLKKFIERP